MFKFWRWKNGTTIVKQSPQLQFQKKVILTSEKVNFITNRLDPLLLWLNRSRLKVPDKRVSTREPTNKTASDKITANIYINERVRWVDMKKEGNSNHI